MVITRKDKWLSMLLTICMIVTTVLSVPFVQGEQGTAHGAEAVQISTAEQFNAIRNDLAGSYVLTQDIDLSGIANFVPIGVKDRALENFTGTLDGQGHKITGLTQNITEINTADRVITGLFGYVANGGTVKNLELPGASITVNTTGTTAAWVGAVTGALGGVLENIKTDGTVNVTLNAAKNAADIGAVVGSMAGTASLNALFADVDVNYNVAAANEAAPPDVRLTAFGNNAGKALTGIKNCVYIGTLNRTGTVAPAKSSGFCGTNAASASNNYAISGYIESEIYTGIAETKSDAELKAGSTFNLDTAFWAAKVGVYPYLKTFGEPDIADTEDGSAEHPFRIDTAAKLDGIRNNLTAHYVLTKDIDLSGYSNFVPIGIKDGVLENFTGALDGQGHRVTGLKQSFTGYNKGSQVVTGLFGYVAAGGSVKNLEVSGLSIAINIAGTAEGSGWVGGLSGALGGDLENIQLSGVMDVSISGRQKTLDLGAVTGSYAKPSMNAVSADVDVNYNIESIAAGGQFRLFPFGNGGGKACNGLTNCLYTGTMTRTGGVAPAVSGFAGILVDNKVSNNYAIQGYIEAETYTGIAVTKTDAELKAGNVFDLDTAFWAAKAGVYPYLKTFGVPDVTEPEDGSAEHPFRIDTAAKLDAVRNNLTAHYILTKDIDLSGYSNFVPIGIKDGVLENFTGALDGQGHKVTGLKQSFTGYNKGSQVVTGLFGYVAAGGSVKNLEVSGLNIAVNIAGTAEGSGWVGGFSGALGGDLENIQLSGVMDVSISGRQKTLDLGAVTGSYAKPSMNAVSADVDVNYNIESIAAGGQFRLFSFGNGGGKDCNGLTNCVYTGTMTRTGGVEPAVSGFAGVTKTNVSKNYAIAGYIEKETYTEIATIKTDTELKSGSTFDLDTTFWAAEAGSYPYLITFGKGGGNPDVDTTTDSAITTSGIIDLMKTTAGYNTAVSLIQTQRTVAAGETLVYDDGANQYPLFYSSLLNAYIGYVPADNVTAAMVTAKVKPVTGTVQNIKYGIIGEGRGTRSSITFKDLYYFDKTVLLDTTIPAGDTERVLAMDVDANYELTPVDMMALIYNYVYGTPFQAAN